VRHDEAISNLVRLFAWQAQVRANRDIRQCNARCREKGNVADADRMKSYGAQILPGHGGPVGPFKIELETDAHGAGDDADMINTECC